MITSSASSCMYESGVLTHFCSLPIYLLLFLTCIHFCCWPKLKFKTVNFESGHLLVLNQGYPPFSRVYRARAALYSIHYNKELLSDCLSWGTGSSISHLLKSSELKCQEHEMEFLLRFFSESGTYDMVSCLVKFFASDGFCVTSFNLRFAVFSRSSKLNEIK